MILSPFVVDILVIVLGSAIVAGVGFAIKLFVMLKQHEENAKSRKKVNCETCEKHDGIIEAQGIRDLKEVKFEVSILEQMKALKDNMSRIETMLDDALNGEDGLWKRVRILESKVSNLK